MGSSKHVWRALPSSRRPTLPRAPASLRPRFLAPWLLVCLALAATGVQAQAGERRAGIVVQYGDGQVAMACVRFSEPALDGLTLLERSGLPVVAQAGAAGAAVCKIGPEGCAYPAESCFCRREGARSIYWAFYTLAGDAWAYASLGAANTPVRDGDVHGWAWGLGDSASGALPPVISLEAVCGPDQPAPPAAPSAAPPAPPPAPASPAPPAPPGVPSAAAPPAPPAAPTQGSAWGYLGFGALIVILGLGAVALARRR